MFLILVLLKFCYGREIYNLCIFVFVFLGYILRNGMVGLYNVYIIDFNSVKRFFKLIILIYIFVSSI